ncbi:MAG: c-type cytochrome [Verrucomicrobiaceae bacterium]|nr:MAG: c-type cytochrome [Verrucomicrobiaceae bacterium]
MNHLLLSLTAVMLMGLNAFAADSPLRVFIRGGEKTHGPGAHDHAQFLKDWVPLLNARGIKADGALTLPTDEQLANTDVLLMYAQDGGTVPPERQAALETFLKRGGGLVVIHTASVSAFPDHWKKTIGGAWRPGVTKWREGPMDLYYTESQELGGGDPITRGASNFHFDDEIYYDMDLSPDIKVLATSYTPNSRDGKKQTEGNRVNVYDIQPQMWTYERTAEGGATPYRAFVSIPGHLYKNFSLPHYRAILMRGIAWAGKRGNLDEFTQPEEISSLTYPDGGPQKPEDTLKNLEIHPDFTMTLVAAEPLITKPMNFDWDPAGRLWVAETPEYPNGRRGMRPDYRGKEWKDRGGIDFEPGVQNRPGHDKVSILTDTDGDGVMDKKDVFFEGLDLVTGLVFHKDGVIVTQAPDILWLRDTDGDGKADKTEKLYTNLGTGDTHAVINNPRRGWDGWIYATHGYSSSPDVTSGDGGKHFGNIGSGVVRFKPDGSAIEQYSSKGGNTWGLQITADNRVMWTQPTSGTILEHVVIPEYALARGKVSNTPSFNVVIGSPKTWPAMTADQLPYVQIDFVGSFTATAGTVIYDGGSWPAEYNGDYFTTEPTINIIHHERLTPKGSSYTGHKLPGREETEFVRSRDMWWRPIEVRVAPDGSMYVGDFYNQAVIHNDTRGPDHNKVNAAVRPDRDHYFGRIWKLNQKDAKKIEVPDLSRADVPVLAKALNHANRSVRMTASRLLTESGKGAAEVEAVLAQGNPETKIAALWTLQGLGALKPELLTASLSDADASVRRNAAQISETASASAELEQKTAKLISDENGGVRVAALIALGGKPVSDETAKLIVAEWPKFEDDFQRSAAVGAAVRNPAAAIAAALDSANPASLAQLVTQLADSIGDKNNADAAVRLVTLLAGKTSGSDDLKRGALDALTKSLKAVPAMTPELKNALSTLLQGGASASALPLAVKWDAGRGEFTEMVGGVTKRLEAELADSKASDSTRLAAARSLLGLRETNPGGLTAVLKVLGSDASPDLQRQLLSALSGTSDVSVGTAIAAAYPKLPEAVQPAAFDALLKRADWSLALIKAMRAKEVDPAAFGPANAFRLRKHPNLDVARQANEVLDELNPMAKAKNEIIAKLAPEIEKPGNVETGKLIFNATCAVCHKFGDTGAEIGPALTGMGSHAPSELLTAIVDPNREVDPSFLSWNIETKDGQFYAGVIARENPSAISMKSLAGQQEIKTADIKSRVNTGLSLMPEGFDGLGPEVLRDIIAYMVSVDGGKFRTLDLGKAFTATTGQGLYNSPEQTGDTVVLAKTGTVNVEGIPFNLVSPDRATGNVIVLKGGPRGTFSRTLPQKVEIKVGGFKANRLHFLGGVGGWAARGPDDGEVCLKATVNYADGTSEELVMRDGVEIADYNGQFDVPGSRAENQLVKNHAQIRWFTKLLKSANAINSVVLESTGNVVAPTTFAITAELADPKSPAPGALSTPPAPKTAQAAPAPAGPLKWEAGKRVLLIGGGSSHDFNKFFNLEDTAILKAAGFSVNYTSDPLQAAAGLGEADAVVISTNQAGFGAVPFRKALGEFAAAGKGIVLLHPGIWYNFNDWPEFNKVYAGGGSRGHDPIGKPFEVKTLQPDHPVMKGVPASFPIVDELYYMIPDTSGSPIEVLAEATSPLNGKVFPSVWTVRHEKARIACITLGHDARAHDLEAFRSLLKNAVTWSSETAKTKP